MSLSIPKISTQSCLSRYNYLSCTHNDLHDLGGYFIVKGNLG